MKASELCYKSISYDVTEDKKHIDLSAEPLILVCAAGLAGSNVDDVAKEIAIYRAHRAAPIVIASEGEHRFGAALETIVVPTVNPLVAFVLSAMAGHLFGYEAALAIDASARPLRESRAAIQATVSDVGAGRRPAGAARPACSKAPTATFLDGIRTGSYDGDLEAGTAVRLASLLRYAIGIVPLDVYQVEHGAVGTPSRVVEDLTAALTKAIEELTRPVDAIKHQAKTVTVGISRSDEELLHVPLRPRGAGGRALRATRSATAPCARWSRSIPRSNRSWVSPATGSRATSTPTPRPCTSSIAAASRSTCAPVPTTTPGWWVPSTASRPSARSPSAAAGIDRRTFVIVPEVKDNETVGLTLLHARFAPHVSADVARTVLQGYQGRYGALRDAVTETVPAFDDSVLGGIEPHRPADRAGLCARRSLAMTPSVGVRGLGSDLVEVERFRLALDRRASLSQRLFTDDERSYSYGQHDPVKSLAVRFGAKEATMKALGVGLGAFAFRDVEVVRDGRAARPPWCFTAPRPTSPASRGVTAWQLSLTHTDTTAMAVVIALG